MCNLNSSSLFFTALAHSAGSCSGYVGGEYLKAATEGDGGDLIEVSILDKIYLFHYCLGSEPDVGGPRLLFQRKKAA